LREATRAKIEHETGQIDELLAGYMPLLELVSTRSPDLTEITAIAAVLHSFYNGIENIFGIVAKEIDQEFPAGNNWHRTLLEQMAQSSRFRKPLINEKDRSSLLQYLSFRHFFRHAYSFHLDWEQMAPLVNQINSVWTGIRPAIEVLWLSEENSDGTKY